MRDKEIIRQIGALMVELWKDGLDTGRKEQWVKDQPKIKEAESKGYRRGMGYGRTF